MGQLKGVAAPAASVRPLAVKVEFAGIDEIGKSDKSPVAIVVAGGFSMADPDEDVNGAQITFPEPVPSS